MKRIVLICLVVAASLPVAALVHADPLGTSIPAGCVAHTGWGDGAADVPGDFRCAGRAVQFHTAGVAASPGLLWAGQWLFVDEAGQYRVGSCTFNRGIHPTTGSRSSPVAQTFPNDPSGAKGAYLSRRYGDTTDDLTAAALWAVFHFYAQDAAGTRRATDGSAPLVPALDRLAAMSGDDELQARAIALDAEAQRFSAPWRLTVDLAPDGTATASLHAGDVPVEGASIKLWSSGQQAPIEVATDGAGHASTTFDVGTLRVTAAADAPGAAVVYRGQPAAPDPWGAQTLVTGGAPVWLTAEAAADVPETTTTEAATTTTSLEATSTTMAPETSTTSEPATTTAPATTTSTSTSTAATTSTAAPTTTTEAGTTSSEPATTTELVVAEPTTTVETSTTSTPAEAVTTTTPPVIAAPAPELPRTGGGAGPAAYLGTALLVGGIGLLGTVRRRTRRIRPPFFDVE